jgi:hypothetical protein
MATEKQTVPEEPSPAPTPQPEPVADYKFTDWAAI